MVQQALCDDLALLTFVFSVIDCKVIPLLILGFTQSAFPHSNIAAFDRVKISWISKYMYMLTTQHNR